MVQDRIAPHLTKRIVPYEGKLTDDHAAAQAVGDQSSAKAVGINRVYRYY